MELLVTSGNSWFCSVEVFEQAMAGEAGVIGPCVVCVGGHQIVNISITLSPRASLLQPVFSFLVTLAGLIMTLFQASNDYAEPPMKGCGSPFGRRRLHTVAFCHALRTHSLFHVHLSLCISTPLRPCRLRAVTLRGCSEQHGLWIDFSASKGRPPQPNALSSEYPTQRQG